MTDADALPGLLEAGEQAAFHGRPVDAVAPLERAVLLARSLDRPIEVAAAAWLLGVALVAAGRYGSALVVLTPLVDAGGAPGAAGHRRLFGALAASTGASAQRQLGRHATARAADLVALDLADDGVEARFDAVLGLAGDAVGLDEAGEAAARLTEARALLPAGGEHWWRQRVRLAWTAAEVALLEGRVTDAAALAAGAVAAARTAGAPRHVAKGLLIQGIAEVDQDDRDAAATLRSAATLAESLGALPLVWPARALLGALVAGSHPDESGHSLAVARSAVLEVAGDLPPAARGEWLARPEVSTLLAG